jgi:hypothetical protein
MFEILQAFWVVAVESSFKKSTLKESGGIRSRDHGGQRPHLTMWSLQKACKRVVVFVVWAVASLC